MGAREKGTDCCSEAILFQYVLGEQEVCLWLILSIRKYDILAWLILGEAEAQESIGTNNSRSYEDHAVRENSSRSTEQIMIWSGQGGHDLSRARTVTISTQTKCGVFRMIMVCWQRKVSPFPFGVKKSC